MRAHPAEGADHIRADVNLGAGAKVLNLARRVNFSTPPWSYSRASRGF